MNQGFGGRVPFSRGQVLSAAKKGVKVSKWPEAYGKKVTMKKIKRESFHPWITKRIGELMYGEDEVPPSNPLEPHPDATIRGCSPGVRRCHLRVLGFII